MIIRGEKVIFLGHKLRRLREVMNLSTVNVEKLTGVPQSRLSEMENGQTKNPQQKTIERLCRGLKVNKEFFFIEDAQLPNDVLPNMSEDTLKFIMSGENIPYIKMSQKAKENGLSPETIEKIMALMTQKKE